MSVLVSGLFNAAGMLAPDGRCKTLDAAANGYVRAEARGVLILEATGVAPGRGPVAVVGAAVNQDGRSSSLTAPHGPSQQAAIRAALRVAELDGSRVATLQMHGTGTALGDPIEIGSALAVFERRADAPSLALEAAKSRVGHTETAAGVVGVAQPLENLARLAVAPVAHLTAVNAHVRSVLRSALGDASRRVGAPAMPRQNAALAGSRAKTTRRAACPDSRSREPTDTSSRVASSRRANERPRRRVGRRAVRRRSRSVLGRPGGARVPSRGARGRRNRVAIVAFLDPRTHAHLWDHRVMRRALFPGAGLFELALCGAATMGGAADATPRGSVALTAGSVPAPLVLADRGSTVEVVIRSEPRGTYVVVDTHGASSRRTSHLDARVETLAGVDADDDGKATRDASSSSSRGPVRIFPDGFRRRSPPRRVAFGTVVERRDAFTPYHTHPASLDNALQLAAACHVPTSLGSGFDARADVDDSLGVRGVRGADAIGRFVVASRERVRRVVDERPRVADFQPRVRGADDTSNADGSRDARESRSTRARVDRDRDRGGFDRSSRLSADVPGRVGRRPSPSRRRRRRPSLRCSRLRSSRRFIPAPNRIFRGRVRAFVVFSNVFVRSRHLDALAGDADARIRRRRRVVVRLASNERRASSRVRFGRARVLTP